MSTTAKAARYRSQLKAIDVSKREAAKPADQQDKAKLMPPKERIKVRLRCKICGRSRAVFRKFGICRIHFRDMASSGLIPGVRKASW